LRVINPVIGPLTRLGWDKPVSPYHNGKTRPPFHPANSWICHHLALAQLAQPANTFRMAQVTASLMRINQQMRKATDGRGLDEKAQ
jgi:hypothetical protein